MFRTVSARWPRRMAVLAALVACLACLRPLQAAPESLKDDTSLKFAPSDVSFYVSIMRMREVFDKVASSNAIAKFTSIPWVQFGLAAAQAQWQNPQNPQLAMVKQMLADPQNQELVGLLKDAVSHEIFFYGGKRVGGTIALLNDINSAVSAGQLEALSSGDFENVQSHQLRKVLEVLEERGDDLKVPVIVKGMKLSAADAGLNQLRRLEALAKQLLEQQPQLQSRFSREQIAGGEFLTLKLDGTLIPWSEILEDAEQADEELTRKLMDKLNALEMVVSIGVREDYLLISVGPDNAHLNALGQGELLYDRDEMAPLREAADKPITDMAYVGGDFMERVSAIDRQMDQLVIMTKQFAPMMLGTAPELQEELIADMEKAAEYVKQHVPKPGSYSAFSHMTPAGFESYAYAWSGESGLDASRNLPIVNHVGGDPIAFYAARGKSDPEDIKALGTFLSRLAYYGEQVALQQFSESQLEAYEKLKADFMPLIERFGQVTQEKLVPAFADSQSALVLDAKSKSTSWIRQMPPAEEELPMLELGLVMGVSDAGLIKGAFGDYFDIVQEALDKLHEASTGELSDTFPSPVPPIKLAKPSTKDVEGGTVYYYALPEQTGLDKQVAPNAGLSEKVMAASLLPRFTARLLSDMPLQATGPLANTDRPLGAAFQFNFAGLLDAVSPWIDYVMAVMGMPVNAQAQPGMGMAGNPMANIGPQIDDVMEVLKCFRGVSGVTYKQGDAMVTHAEWRFEDLEESN